MLNLDFNETHSNNLVYVSQSRDFRNRWRFEWYMTEININVRVGTEKRTTILTRRKRIETFQTP